MCVEETDEDKKLRMVYLNGWGETGGDILAPTVLSFTD